MRREQPSPASSRSNPAGLALGKCALIVLAIGTALPMPAPLRAEQIAMPVNAPPSVVGRWLNPRPTPVLGIHAAVLPTRKVLLFSYPDMMGGFMVPPPTTRSVAYVWSPQGNTYHDVTWDFDVFCSGHSYLADGTLYVTGGWDPTRCVEGGLGKAFLFDPFTEEWSEAPDMKRPRYYPSNATLTDGRVVIMSGYNENCNPVSSVEVYTPGGNSKPVPGSNRTLKLYPQIHVLKSGKVAMVGPQSMTATFDPETGVWEDVTHTRLGLERYFGTSVEIPGKPGKILVCGGYRTARHQATDTCEVIDLNRQVPSWQYVAPMHYARAHLNPVILPDKTILIVGGGTEDDYDIPVLNPELYDPQTDTWTLLPPQRHGRMYHSTAVLLPDGRVLSAGQDQHRLGIDPGGHQSGDFNEIYRPAYLHRGQRPKIGRAPKEIAYGSLFEVTSPQAAGIESIVLISLSAVTHATNTTQRLLDLDFELVPDGPLRVQAPRRNLAPPGYYMLFILNGDRVPSVSRIVRLDGADAITPTS